MTYRGRVHNGQIVLDDPMPSLPEGVRVEVQVVGNGVRITKARQPGKFPTITPLEMPGGPLSDDIVRDRR
jgi:hypothetical protein